MSHSRTRLSHWVSHEDLWAIVHSRIRELKLFQRAKWPLLDQPLVELLFLHLVLLIKNLKTSLYQFRSWFSLGQCIESSLGNSFWAENSLASVVWVVRDDLFNAVLDRLNRYLCRVHLFVPLTFQMHIGLACLVTVETVIAHEDHWVSHPIQCFILLN